MIRFKCVVCDAVAEFENDDFAVAAGWSMQRGKQDAETGRVVRDRQFCAGDKPDKSASDLNEEFGCTLIERVQIIMFVRAEVKRFNAPAIDPLRDQEPFDWENVLLRIAQGKHK